MPKKNIPEINLVLTGRGSAEESLKDLAKKLHLQQEVKFFGFVEFHELVELYQASDVFVVASTAEAQCISMMQGMASGIPVIGVRAHALPEYIKAENGFVVEPHDFKAIAKKIEILYKDPQKGIELGQGGLQFVKKFSIEHITEKWKVLLRQAANLSKIAKKNEN